ncbi:superoxide dismutase [Candidatus Woesearchaeota archaeon CG10_big_fil_rev_8_21_14_0_10_45_16]|nr:MAG: superoxide dismutase [Candidatus Woesearchaeota archaeon CG10_big_fil_rev_8_21_14_0_10_45_16]
MTYKELDFSGLIGTAGFSDKLLQAHFKLYSGYVANTNKAIELLKTLEPGTPQWAEIKRRFGWEFNGMRLHELYFGNMNKEKSSLPEDSALFKKMVATFGSGQACHENFVNTGKLRGIGWVVMCYDKQADQIFNVWINEHDVGHLAGCVPLLVMDVFEHAFVTDYGMDRAAYIKAFIDAIDWKVVQERFEKA